MTSPHRTIAGQHASILSCVLCVFLLVLQSPTAKAQDDDSGHRAFDLALTLYQQGEFKRAAELFTVLGRLGQPAAYRNLGVMAIKGEGMPRDNTRAFVHMQCAALAGDADAVSMASRLQSRLAGTTRSEANVEAERCAAWMKASAVSDWLEQYGNGSLAQAEGLESEWDPSAYSVTRVAPTFPRAAARHGRGGVVNMMMSTDAAGHFRHPEPVFSSERIFLESAVDALLQWRAVPNAGVPGTRKVSQQMNFRMKSGTGPKLGSNIVTQDPLTNQIKSALNKSARLADQGDASAAQSAALFSMYISEIEQEATPEQQTTWLFTAARGPRLRAIEAIVLNRAPANDASDPERALGWALRGADYGSARIRLQLAHAAAKDGMPTEAWFWLAAASARDYPPAVVEYAWALATASSQQNAVANGGRAEVLLKEIEDAYQDKVTWNVALAAAQAAQGDFKGAEKSLRGAEKAARKLGYAPPEVAERRAQYKAKTHTVAPLGSMPWDSAEN